MYEFVNIIKLSKNQFLIWHQSETALGDQHPPSAKTLATPKHRPKVIHGRRQLNEFLSQACGKQV